MIPTKFRFIWLSSFREEDFQKSTNQKKDLPVVACNGSEGNEQSLQRTFHRCFLPSFIKKIKKKIKKKGFISFGQAVSEKKIFRNQPISNKNCLWRPYLLMDQNEMSNLYRGPPIVAAYQVSVHLAKWFQRRIFFRNQPIRDNNCLWRPCLQTYGDKMSHLNRGPSIDASYQVSIHFAKRFQRRRILKISQSETRIVCGGHVS